MKKLALALAATGVLALSVPTGPAAASFESYEARATAMSAAQQARADMEATFGVSSLKTGQFLWKEGAEAGGHDLRVVIGLGDQLAYLYDGAELIAVSTISSGKKSTPSPTGIFSVLEKKPMHRSRKYDNAPMPFMQRIDKWGVALHAGHNPGEPASHGCVRLPAKFAAKLYEVTDVGTPVLIGA
jgi:lipoprotein-anchoring transpeptidase ErfK/SrfK